MQILLLVELVEESLGANRSVIRVICSIAKAFMWKLYTNFLASNVACRRQNLELVRIEEGNVLSSIVCRDYLYSLKRN